MQIMAPPLREDLTLQAAYTFEQNTSYRNRKPTVK
jgi:Asp-tRNA(Asn)/Glu-tRNA(Gln) amidotransferase A subunit family amidase